MERFQPILRALGFSAWFGFALLVFLWLTFPWSRLNERVTVSAADSGVSFRADTLRPAIVGARTSFTPGTLLATYD